MSDYATTCANKLEKAGHLPSQQWMVRKDISVSENGKTYNMKLQPAKKCAAYQIDGVIISEGRKCDKLILVIDDMSNAAVFVELKGKDISHAIDQLEATFTNDIFRSKIRKDDIIRARIVTGGSGPASASNLAMSKAKIRFLTKYNCDLRVLKSRQPDIPL